MKISYEKIIGKLYGIMIFVMALLQTNIPKDFDIVNYIFRYSIVVIIGIMLFCEIYKNKRIKYHTITLYIIFTIILLYNIIVNNLSSDILMIIFCMFMLKNINPNIVLKEYSIGIFSAIILTLLCWRTGIIENYSRGGRNWLGYLFTTFGANQFLHGFLAYVAWKKEKVGIIEWIIFLIANIWFYKMTDTTAVFIVVFLTSIMYIIIKNAKKEKINKFFNKSFIVYLPFILAGFTILLQLLYNKYYNYPLAMKINELMSFRPGLGKKAFETYKVTFLGQSIKWNTDTANNYLFIDSSYLQLLFSGGISLLVLLCTMLHIDIKYAIKKMDIYLILSISMFLIHCITDPQLLSFRYNPFLVIVIYSMMEIKKSRQQRLNVKKQNNL